MFRLRRHRSRHRYHRRDRPPYQGLAVHTHSSRRPSIPPHTFHPFHAGPCPSFKLTSLHLVHHASHHRNVHQAPAVSSPVIPSPTRQPAIPAPREPQAPEALLTQAPAVKSFTTPKHPICNPPVSAAAFLFDTHAPLANAQRISSHHHLISSRLIVSVPQLIAS